MKLVIKVGTSTLAHASGRLNIRRIECLCKVISDLKNAGNEVILVSSGAIGMGTGKLGLAERPRDIPGKQAAAAVGQCELMYTYDKLFSEYNHNVAQLLITAADIDDAVRKENFHNTIERLLALSALPIINENDTVATDEIAIGDNDTLSAVVSASIHAELLVILTDIEGLYDKNPKEDPSAVLIEEVDEITDEIRALARPSESTLGTGGMITKLSAAEIACSAGCNMIIASGKNPEILYDIAEGKRVGTFFKGRASV